MAKYECKHCGIEFNRRGKREAVFCSIDCKAEWQRNQKPATKEWLYQKYVVEKLGTYEIGKLVNRDAKRVWQWLVDYGIETRSQRDSIVIMNKRQSTREKRRRSSSEREISKETRRKISKARKGKPSPHLSGENNGMYGKRGKDNPNWKGGTTPERQSLYSSLKWKRAIKKVWKRDSGHCQRCGKRSNGRDLFHIHHIKSFSDYPDLRSDLSNLVLLCAQCHHWVHSNKNKKRDFIND